jgi:hypothetical protein
MGPLHGYRIARRIEQRKELKKEEARWQSAASIVERFLKISENAT